MGFLDTPVIFILISHFLFFFWKKKKKEQAEESKSVNDNAQPNTKRTGHLSCFERVLITQSKRAA